MNIKIISFALVSMVLFSTTLFVAAVRPSDFNLHEGDVISAEGDPDVYIVNEYGYKRLFVNPAIFNIYGHLGWDKIKKITPEIRDTFITSGLFRNCESNDEKVYGLDVVNDDVANLRWVNTTGDQAVTDDSDFFKKVFCINNKELQLYGSGLQYTSVLQIPKYARGVVAGVQISSLPSTPSPTPNFTPTPQIVYAPVPTPIIIYVTPTPIPVSTITPTSTSSQIPTPSTNPTPTPTPKLSPTPYPTPFLEFEQWSGSCGYGECIRLGVADYGDHLVETAITNMTFKIVSADPSVPEYQDKYASCGDKFKFVGIKILEINEDPTLASIDIPINQYFGTRDYSYTFNPPWIFNYENDLKLKFVFGAEMPGYGSPESGSSCGYTELSGLPVRIVGVGTTNNIKVVGLPVGL
ncbi:MAG: hypothetical protein HYT65_02675 [Candidatus Yanofskybacteria bacterium]|nr:hypothetical protein [Candidatus Yanofskybacteria bacterium]